MEMQLRTLLNAKQQALFTVPVEATVADAVKVMVDGGVGCVLVMDQGRLAGLFTERDLMRRISYQGLTPGEEPIRKHMTRELIVVPPAMTVGEAMSLCTQHRIRHLPVFQEGTLLGMVSAGDLTKWAVQDQQHMIEDLTRYIYGPVDSAAGA
ncbi:MAG: CBS domain-containing protein [Ectothiorhodospiraceae bacterium]|nr:CBS domain-containing protein [Ectothiorhodospiraceae bacterium]